jgi:hypothetical protein
MKPIVSVRAILNKNISGCSSLAHSCTFITPANNFLYDRMFNDEIDETQVFYLLDQESTRATCASGIKLDAEP